MDSIPVLNIRDLDMIKPEKIYISKYRLYHVISDGSINTQIYFQIISLFGLEKSVKVNEDT